MCQCDEKTRLIESKSHLLFTFQAQLLLQSAKAARDILVHALSNWHNWHSIDWARTLAEQLFGLF